MSMGPPPIVNPDYLICCKLSLLGLLETIEFIETRYEGTGMAYAYTKIWWLRAATGTLKIT